jgi:hypothetical protein
MKNKSVEKQILNLLNWLKEGGFGGEMAMGILDFDPWDYAYGVFLQVVEQVRAEEGIKYTLQQNVTSSDGTTLTLDNLEKGTDE